jgi:sugar/nucleoside kinase (ribokinase family)
MTIIVTLDYKMGNLRTIDIVVIGRSCLDYIAIVDRFPLENQKVPLEFRLTEGGGQGGTAACCISTLGGNVAYVGKLGDDTEGRRCMERLKAFGVCTGYIEIVKGGITPVAYAFITASTGERTIIYESNELPNVQLVDTISDLLDRAKIVLIDPEVTYLGKSIKTLKGNRIKLVYDCERWREGIKDVMDTADYFIPSAEFLSVKELCLGQKPLKEKIIQLDRIVHGDLIVTNGEDGAYYISNDKLYHVAAPEVITVDTIGAGDNFHAAFCLAIARGFDLHHSVRLSVAVASLSCREYGGRKGVPQMTEALEVAGNLEAQVVD